MPQKKSARKSRRARGTGSLFFHQARGVWVGRVTVGRKPDGSPLRVECSDRAQAVCVQKMLAAKPPGPTTTIAAWAAKWLSGDDSKPRTRSARRTSVVHHISPVLGSVRVCDLTPYDIEQACKRWAAGGLAPNTVRLVVSHLHTCLGVAVRAGLRSDNPVKVAKKPRRAKIRIDPFTPAEVSLIIAEASKRPTARVLALLAATGCRVGEALALDCPDFDPEAGTVSIERTAWGKGEPGSAKTELSIRVIRVPAAALQAVRDAHGGRLAGPLFTTVSGGRRSHHLARDAWVSLLKRLGLRFRNLHQLRHTWCSVALANGIGLADAAKYLGDRPQTLLRRYLHPTNADPSVAFDRLLDGGLRVGADEPTAATPTKTSQTADP